jgi:hypothetical protein
MTRPSESLAPWDELVFYTEGMVQRVVAEGGSGPNATGHMLTLVDHLEADEHRDGREKGQPGCR